MKILQINAVCGTGSTGRIAADLHGGLRAEGHQCKIAYGRGEALGVPPEDVIRIGNQFDVYYHALMTRLTDRMGFYSRAATRRFIREIEAYDPDIIHLHNIHGYYVNVELLFEYLKRSKKPVVWRLPDCWSFTGHCAFFDSCGCDRWQSACHDCPQPHSYPRSYFDSSKRNYRDKKELFTSLDNLTIVTPSRWLAGLAGESFLSKYPMKVIPNGIDLTKFKPIESDFRERYGLAGKKILLGIANKWEERKGLGVFMELGEKLSDGYRIVLVGLNEKQKKALLPNMMGIDRTSTMSELAEIYSAADIFVNTTFEDNFPTVNLEALACGTPVITFATGGSIESITETVGISVAKGNMPELQMAIEEFQMYGHKDACVTHSKKYCKRRMTEDYIDIYFIALEEAKETEV